MYNMIKSLLTANTVVSVDDSTKLQTMKVKGSLGSVRDKVERIQNYGLSSKPPVGSEAVVGNLSGSSDHPTVIACDSSAWRILGLEDGEVVLYSKFGAKILLNALGGFDIEDNHGNTIVMSTSGVLINGNLEVLR
jgi:phage baseplate assembly protein V